MNFYQAIIFKIPMHSGVALHTCPKELHVDMWELKNTSVCTFMCGQVYIFTGTGLNSEVHCNWYLCDQVLMVTGF